MLNRRDVFLAGSAIGLATGGLATGGIIPGAAEAATRNLPTPVKPAAAASTREVLSLNKGWRFLEGDVPFPKVIGHSWTYGNAKAGASWGAASPSYDDSEWGEVTLPHDFASFQPIEQSANVSQGYRKRGIAWYRNLLRFDAADRGKHIELQLDGISTHATIWFNGTLINRNWSGYNSIYVDLTPFVTYGEALNSLVIRVDADQMQGWWYEGAGIYRNSWIIKRAPVHIITDGVFAHPIKTADGWTLPIEVTLNNIANTEQGVQVVSELWDDTIGLLARAEASVEVGSLHDAVATFDLIYNTPRLWSVDTPNLYNVVTRIEKDGVTLDEVTTQCGFRSQRFDADKGFFLNDKPVKLKGVCIHQDHAGVGVAVPYGILQYRLKRLKELGCNAIRCSHNAQDKHFYELCDRLGFLVMDENRVFNPSPIHMAELEWVVRRDRNHPSIILWSVFNEEPMQGTEQGYEMVRRMREVVKALDTSRPVTAAMNDGLFTPLNVSKTVDVVGFNYQYQSYDAFHKANPTIPLTSSEDGSAYMTRGEFKTLKDKHIIASYDDDAAPWGATHRRAWKEVATRDFIAGAFYWTGFDYHGEPTPHEWPSNSSFFGIMDLCGFEKTAFYLHKAQWSSEPTLYLAPHWNWAGGEGKDVMVMAFHNMDEVELFLNGKSLGKQKGDIYEMNRWKVAYQPGKLEAFGYKSGKVIAKYAVETTGAPVRLKLTPFRTAMSGDGLDAQPFRVEALDAKGRHVPLAQNQITFKAENGDIIGLGNGNPNDISSEKGNSRALFNGLAQVIVQTREGFAGKLKLTASAEGLTSASVAVDVVKAAPWTYQSTRTPVQIINENWRRAPLSDTRPDANLRAADSDMNSWDWFRPGSLFEAAKKAGFSLCASDMTPFSKVQKQGGVVQFVKARGVFDVYVDGVLLGQKTDPAEAAFAVKLPPASGKRRLSVIFKVAAGEVYGFGDVIQVRT